MKIMMVVGARPNFMKVGPIITAARQHNEELARKPHADRSSQPIHHILVHTGQHYDPLMSDSFFTCLNLPAPDYHLGVGSGSQAGQTAEIMRKFEPVLLDVKPDVLLVVGDVNSTVACALVAAKIVYDGSGKRPLIGHVEAGLRSFDRTMPEEVNRVLTDHLADLLFVTEESGTRNLAHEGVSPDKIHFVGNTMIDSLLSFREKAETSTILDDLRLREGLGGNNGHRTVAPYVLLTLHRPANVDDRDAFQNILDGISELANRFPIIFPAHPRTQKRIREFGFERRFEWNLLDSAPRERGNASAGIHIINPQGYLDFLQLMKNASMVVTDSGGIQEETTVLGVRCVTVRENTERPVTLTAGTNVLAGTRAEGIRTAIRSHSAANFTGRVPEKWDGCTATRILDVINREVQPTASEPGFKAALATAQNNR